MEQTTKTCPSCGASVQQVEATCPACQTPFLAQKPVEHQTTQRSTTSPGNGPAAGHRPQALMPASDLPSAISGYRVLKEIGRGGMGTVYLAREEGWGREVALKVMHVGLPPKQVKRFLEEATITAQLQHPAIVPIYSLGRTSDGRDFYSMKRVQGRTLSEIVVQLREGVRKVVEQYSVRRRAAVLLAACEGVALAHDRGVIHRDLKPSNIMVGDYGEVYVLDWGLAKVLFGMRGSDLPPELSEDLEAGPAQEHPEHPRLAPPAASSARVSGTPAYMSPEQARGETRAIDRRSDVWSLGAILYQLLTLHAPVPGETPTEVLRNAAEGRVAPPEQFPQARQAPRELLDIVGRALAPDPEARYPDARHLAEDLRAYLDGRGRWRQVYAWEASSGAWPESDWQAVLGKWELDARGLYPAARGSAGAVLLSAKRYPGDVRLELTGTCEDETEETGELSCFLCAPDPDVGVNETDGYCMQFGADWSTSAKIAKNDLDVAVRTDVAPRSGRRYSLVAERVGNHLRLEVDGEEVAAFTDLFPLAGSRVGLYGWERGSRVEALRIYRRGLDAVVSCMAVPDHDFNSTRYPEALAGYLRIAEELDGREEGWLARFKAGLCHIETNNEQGAEAEFTRLEKSPGEVLAHLGRSLLSSREGDYRRELLRLSAARRVGAGASAQAYVLSRLWQRADELRLGGQFEAAIAFLKEVLDADPEGGKRRAEALGDICACHITLGHEEEALRMLDRMVRESSPYHQLQLQVYNSVHLHFCQAAKWEAALDTCRRCEEKVPGVAPFVWALRGEVARLRGQWAEAEAALAEGLRHSDRPPARSLLLRTRGLLERDRGRLREAEDLLAEAAALGQILAPADALVSERAWVVAVQGRHAEAVNVLAERLKRNSHQNRMFLLSQIGKLLRVRGDFDRAHDCFRQVMANLSVSAVNSREEIQVDLGLLLLARQQAGEARRNFHLLAGAKQPSFPSLVGRTFLAWNPGEPLPEPPEPGPLCPWLRRPEYFFLLGEFARLTQRPGEVSRAFRRALIESMSPWQPYAWLSAVRLAALGESLPAHVPAFAPLL